MKARSCRFLPLGLGGKASCVQRPTKFHLILQSVVHIAARLYCNYSALQAIFKTKELAIKMGKLGLHKRGCRPQCQVHLGQHFLQLALSKWEPATGTMDFFSLL